MLFRDRYEAGRLLGQALQHLRQANPIVLALPRGGVPVGYEVATALAAPLDLALVRKIGAPGAPEYAVGAVVGGDKPEIVTNEDAVRMLHLPRSFIEAEAARQLVEIERQRRLYLGDRPPPRLEGRTVIVVDDGIATGSTVRAVLRALKAARPGRLVLAAPVAPGDSMASLRAEANEVVVLEAPADFRAVSIHYETFGQTSDQEVVDLLRAAAQRATSDRRTA